MDKQTAKTILNQGPERIAKLNRRELASQVRILGNTVNRRLDRLQAAGLTTPATYDPYTGRTMGRISTRGKSLQQLRSEFTRAAQFLNAQTSTVTGARKWQNATIKGLENAGVTDVNPENFLTLWESYEKLRSMDSSVASRGLKYAVLQEIQNEVRAGNRSADSITNALNSRLGAIYEEQERERLSSASARGLDFWGYRPGDDEESEEDY